HWRNEDLGAIASRWIGKLWLSRSYFDVFLTWLSFMSRETIDQFTVGSFTYAVLLSIEGIGLCRRKRWAEYMTVGITASLLPFEQTKAEQTRMSGTNSRWRTWDQERKSLTR